MCIRDSRNEFGLVGVIYHVHHGFQPGHGSHVQTAHAHVGVHPVSYTHLDVYKRQVEQIRAELDALVGLAPVKEYVFGLADNLQVQQRRAAAGLSLIHILIEV